MYPPQPHHALLAYAFEAPAADNPTKGLWENRMLLPSFQ
jgi:hypothetical protein